MSQPVSDLQQILDDMAPELSASTYVYAIAMSGEIARSIPAFAVIEEAEGITVITTESEAQAAGLPIVFRADRITLSVHSDLFAVGLTAAVAKGLAEAGIACNVVAGAYHDHVFVPSGKGRDALALVNGLRPAGWEQARSQL